jgi:hypothetical protein
MGWPDAYGKTTWWEGVARGRFPQPVKLGSRVTAWSVKDIRELITQITANSGSTVVRSGVRVARNALHVRRNERRRINRAHESDQVPAAITGEAQQ